MGIPEGWVWTDKGRVVEAVVRGARMYRRKYGAMPTTCYVHRSREEQVLDVDGAPVAVVPCGGMNLFHYWFCKLEEEAL